MRRRNRYPGGGPPSIDVMLRLRRVSIGMALVISVLVFRLWVLQFLEGENYLEQSIQNCEQRVEIASRRGKILDRNLNVLAEDIWNYNLLFDKAHCPDPDDLPRILATLSEITGHKERFLHNRLAREQPDPKGRRLILKGIPFHTMLAVEERALVLPGIVTERIPGRYYLHDDLGAHVLGYVREIDAIQLAQRREQGYGLGDRIGKTGIELVYEDSLRGRDGSQIIQTDSRGRQRDVLRVEKQPQTGQDVVLNLDSGLQRKAEDILGASIGVMIALDPRNGAVLTMATSPRYNLNTLSQELGRLWNDDDRPLYHRAVSSLYPPGSVFKIFEAFGLLEEGVVSQYSEVFCPGHFSLGGDNVWRCWKKYGHGQTGIVKALRISCDVFFYEMGGRRLGISKMANWARNFGLDKVPTNIDLPNEKTSYFPSKATIARITNNEKTRWYRGDTVNASIGQGYILFSPIQIAVAAGAIANGGSFYQPRIAAGVIQSGSNRKIHQTISA